MFELGRTYTRDEIHDAVGGSKQSYLPTKDGRVGCACLTTKENPDAPDVVLVGDGEVIIASAEQYAVQVDPVPTFWKRAVGEWEYVGQYRVVRTSREPSEVARRAGAADRDDVVMILFLGRVSLTHPKP